MKENALKEEKQINNQVISPWVQIKKVKAIPTGHPSPSLVTYYYKKLGVDDIDYINFI